MLVAGSPAAAPAPPPHVAVRARRQSKAEIADAFIRSLRERGGLDVDAPGVAAAIRDHFRLLPSRYALDVNLASLDVLNHKRLLDSARADPSAVSFQVRPVDVAAAPPSSAGRAAAAADGGAAMARAPSFSASESLLSEAAALSGRASGRRGLPRPAFGSSPNLQALVLEAEADRDSRAGSAAPPPPEASFYEITVASVDAPKLLSRLSEALGDVGLNICEAHAFNTSDGFSLDVFVVNGWAGGPDAPDDLEDVLSDRLQQLPPPLAADGDEGSGGGGADGAPAGAALAGASPPRPAATRAGGHPPSSLPLPPDDFELGADDVVCHERVASGAFGDLYRGVYCGAEVAVKVLRGVATDAAAVAEFAQEVAIMRKVRHRNVVQFIGACTRPPNLCIVFEFLRGGSVFDWMRRHGPPRLPAALKMAAEVARGMDYLHKRRVVHRDLKTANLLLDDAGCVKIADFGVARLLDVQGVMTAETGTYRWMAPEVIEHTPYTETADVYSYGVLLWELLTARVPYDAMTPLQAAVGVVQKGLRPPIPPGTPADLAAVMAACWDRDPAARPGFDELKGTMEALYLAARAAEAGGGGGGGGGASGERKGGGGLLSKLRGARGGGAGGGGGGG